MSGLCRKVRGWQQLSGSRLFVESLQRTHVGVGYSDRDIDDPQQVCTDILGISQPLQDGVDLLSSCSVERLLEVCHRLRFRGPYRGNIVAAK